MDLNNHHSNCHCYIVLAYHVALQIMRHKSKKRSQDDNTITLFTSVNQTISETSSEEDIVTHS